MTGAVLIGSASGLAQRPSPAVDPTRVTLDVAETETHFRARLDPARSERWRGAFAHAQALGGCVVAPLTELASRRRADPREWLLYHAAIAAAGGEDSDRVLIDALAAADGDRAQFGLAMLIALGPDARMPWAAASHAFDRLARAAPIVQTAALLSRSHFPGASAPAAASYDSSDCGVAAAARMFGSRQETKSVRRDRPDLIARAEWLGAFGDPIRTGEIADLLETLSRRDPGGRASRLDAALRLASTADPTAFRGVLRSLEPEVATVLASNPIWRPQLSAADLVPVDRIDVRWRARAALAFILVADGGELRDATGAWATDRETAAVGHLALAWRLIRARLEGIEDAVDLDWAAFLPEHGCREWVRLAGGGKPLTRAAQTGLPEIDRLLSTWPGERLLAMGERSMLAVTERSLTSLGAHLGAIRRERELELVAELTLVGSHYAAAVLGDDSSQRLRPRGIPPSDEVFAIVFEYWRFVTETAARRVDPGRLR